MRAQLCKDPGSKFSLPKEFHRNSWCERPAGSISKGCQHQGRMGCGAAGGVHPRRAHPAAGWHPLGHPCGWGGSRCGHAVLCQQCWESSSPNPPVPAQCRYTQAGAKQALLCALWLCGSVLGSLCWCAAVGWEGRGFLGTDSEEMGQESDTGRRWAKQRDFVALLLPQLAPAEGKSHFFPDSGINYSNATRTLAGGN